jgi:hypothetical protein
MPSRFLRKVAKPVSRFIATHPKLSRFLKEHLPGVSQFFTPHIAPEFTQRARPGGRQPRMGI